MFTILQSNIWRNKSFSHSIDYITSFLTSLYNAEGTLNGPPPHGSSQGSSHECCCFSQIIECGCDGTNLVVACPMLIRQQIRKLASGEDLDIYFKQRLLGMGGIYHTQSCEVLITHNHSFVGFVYLEILAFLSKQINRIFQY
jgi:hypothetical protein